MVSLLCFLGGLVSAMSWVVCGVLLIQCCCSVGKGIADKKQRIRESHVK